MVCVLQETNRTPSYASIGNNFTHRRDNCSCNVQFLLYPPKVLADLAQCLNLTGQKLDILVNGFNSTESFPTQQVEVRLFANFDHHENSFKVTKIVKDRLSVGSETIDVPILQDRFPHLQPVEPIVYNYSDVEIILGQDVFHAIKAFRIPTRRKSKKLVAFRIPFGWVLSGPLPSLIGVRATTFKCNVEDVALADQVKKWFKLESYGSFKQAVPRAAAEKHSQKFLTLPRFMMAVVKMSDCSGLKTTFIFPKTFTLHWSNLSLLKSVLKDIWPLSGQQWDDPLPNELCRRFTEWYSGYFDNLVAILTFQ